MALPRQPAPLARRLLAVAAVLADVLAATGAPLPSRQVAHGQQEVPYPCQDHPCGCVDSGACWAGDCCCFTLEQKVAWAEANGVEPPAHVRPAVESRKARAAPAKPKKSCCSGEEAEPHACCDHDRKESERPAAVPSGVRLVAVVFAQKCRGETLLRR